MQATNLPLRHYEGFMADSSRWERFRFRPDDVVISTPAKCGTTWMQTIVGMLLLDRTDLGAPLGTLSPWLDMQIRTEADVSSMLEAQRHRRFIKTHTPLDGVPLIDPVTYIVVVRHPLDAALSDMDHADNMRNDRAVELRTAVAGLAPRHAADRPNDPAAFLRWFIDNDEAPTGSGPNGLADYCDQVATYWARRDLPNVHLFHYADLWRDRDGEMRRVAAALGVPVDEQRWPAFVEAAGLGSMRARADETAPDAHLDLWESAEKFFRVGGTREWASLLGSDGVAHFEARLHTLAGDAAGWAAAGRGALEPA
jgi:hypothetical protein